MHCFSRLFSRQRAVTLLVPLPAAAPAQAPAIEQEQRAGPPEQRAAHLYRLDRDDV